MVRKLFTIAAVTFLMVPLVGCRVQQTEEGEMPEVDVETQGGALPEYDVETPDIEIETEPREVPTGVDVTYPGDTEEEEMEEQEEAMEEEPDAG